MITQTSDQYEVIEASDRAELAEKVNAWIARGWRPVGGVSLNEYASQRVYCQAMIRRDYPSPYADIRS